MMDYYFYYPLENNIFVAQNAEFFENSLTLQEASGSHEMIEESGSDVGLELIQEDDKQPSKTTRKRHDEVEPIEHELGDLNEPPNYKVALSDPKFDKWINAMNTEMQSIKDNQVWSLVNLSPNARTVMNIRAIRILLAIATLYDYEILQMDVKPAFLNGHLSKDVYMVKPKVFVDLKHPSKQNPGEIYWTAVKTILKYLRNTKDMVLVYRAKAELRVSCYVDASFQTDKDDTKSQVGYVFVLNSRVVDWKITKQSTTAMYSIEVEYIAAAEASMKAIWMRKFIDGLGDVVPSNKRTIKMLCDNEPAIAIANDPGILKGSRHFQRKSHYIHEVI
nr:putative retrotransposon protein [Tanacetum cinerariifolium]